MRAVTPVTLIYKRVADFVRNIFTAIVIKSAKKICYLFYFSSFFQKFFRCTAIFFFLFYLDFAKPTVLPSLYELYHISYMIFLLYLKDFLDSL